MRNRNGWPDFGPRQTWAEYEAEFEAQQKRNDAAIHRHLYPARRENHRANLLSLGFTLVGSALVVLILLAMHNHWFGLHWKGN